MPAPLRITLTPEEDFTLVELRLAQVVPQRTRDRAHMLRLNAQGWNVPAIAEMFECHQHTVRRTLRQWQNHGLAVATRNHNRLGPQSSQFWDQNKCNYPVV